MGVRTPEERLSSLEESFTFMREGIVRVEKTLDKLDLTVSSIVEKLDGRYPSKESVDLRIRELTTELQTARDVNEKLTEEVHSLRKDVDILKSWRSWLTGTLATVVAVGVLAFEYLRQWLGVVH